MEHLPAVRAQEPGAEDGWRQWVTAFLDLLFPPLCSVCGLRLGAGRQDPLCGACWERLERIAPPYCARCGRPFYALSPHAAWEGSAQCEGCWREPPPFAYARAVTLYGDTVREAIHALKFGRKTALARPLGDLLAKNGRSLLPAVSVDGLVPVPLHPTREAERGFNQSLLLVRRVARQWRLPVFPAALRRVVATRPQTEFSTRDRRANVRGAFSLSHPAQVEGRHLLVIDDVFTTGATVVECCRVLLEGGASTVGVLTVARVP